MAPAEETGAAQAAPLLASHNLPITNWALETRGDDPASEAKSCVNSVSHIQPAAQINAPTLARPDLVGPFNASAHNAEDFDFSAQSVCFRGSERKTHFKVKAKRVKGNRTKHNRLGEATILLSGLTSLSPMKAFQMASKLVLVNPSPRKRVMLESSKDEEDVHAEFEEFHEDPALDIWDAKASIRNHLLEVSPVHSTATKRRVNGHERNWIRAHRMDADVKYLLQFPGDMPAEKARDLIARRDMLVLDVIEEDMDGSIVMEMVTPSTAEHTSELNRLERLEKAVTTPRVMAVTVEGEMGVVSGTPTPIDGDDNSQSAVQPAFETATEEFGQAPSKPDLQTSPDRTPQTPQVNGQHEIVDVDLHKQSDIFASAMPQRHQEMTPAVPAQPAWTTVNTPQPLSSPFGVLDVDEDTSVQWSPLAHTPAPARATEPAPHTPIITNIEVPMETDKAPTSEDMQQGGQFMVRFKVTVEEMDISEDHNSPAPEAARLVIQVDETTGEPSVQEDGASSDITTREVQAQGPVQDDDRNYLLRFMNKHQAGKSRNVAVSPSLGTLSEAVFASPAPRMEPSVSAPGPKTPESVPVRMHISTPSFVVARVPDTVETPVRTSTSRPASSRRTPLGQLDSNSPSPVKARTGKRKLDVGSDAEKFAEGKDVESEKEPEPSPKRRRGLRARKPVAPPTPVPANARAVRSGEKDLASLTRANTRANKGNAVFPEDVLERFAADPMGQKWKERKEVVDAKAARAALAATKAAGKNVRWAETLAQYREGSPVMEEDEICDAPVSEREDVFRDKPNAKEEVKSEENLQEDVKEKEKPKPKRGRPVTANTIPVVPKTPPKSKLPAPVRGAKPIVTTSAAAAKKTAAVTKAVAKIPKVEDNKVTKPRPTRAAAQKSNLSMGLTATGTPIRRGRGRAKAST